MLVGYYQTGAVAGPMGDLAPAERLQRALEQGAVIHPQYRSTFENAFSIAWQKVRALEGRLGAVHRGPAQERVPDAAEAGWRTLSRRRLHVQHERMDGRCPRVGTIHRQVDS